MERDRRRGAMVKGEEKRGCNEPILIFANGMEQREEKRVKKKNQVC